MIGQFKQESRVSVTDNSANSIYGRGGMEAGPDGMLSFQPGNALMQNANGSIRNNPSITEKDNSLYQKGGGGVPLSFGGSNLN